MSLASSVRLIWMRWIFFRRRGSALFRRFMSRGRRIWRDGYARASGKHGVCIAQNGPGITNFVTAIAAAYWAHSPVVAITPETGSHGQGLGGFQEDRAGCRFSRKLPSSGACQPPERMAEMTARCFDYAMGGTRADPAEYPARFLLWRGRLSDIVAAPCRAGGGERGQFAGRRRFAGAGEVSGHRFRRRVIFSGGVEACKALAERLKCAVVTSYLHNDSFPCQSPFVGGRARLSGFEGGDEVAGRRRMSCWRWAPASVLLALCRSMASIIGRRRRRLFRLTAIIGCWG